MPTVNSNIEIGNNFIRFHNKSLKLSSIARSWIFKFQNIEKKEFEKAKIEYENAKVRYEERKIRERADRVKYYFIAAIISGCIALFLFFTMGVIGIIPLIIAGICAYMSYQTKNENVAYPYPPPTERPFPDKFGLGIEMNSGYTEMFTAIGKSGVIALSELQRDIDEADKRQGITVFNMNDNRITVENNDGIISMGDYSDNKIEKREPVTV